MVLYDPTHDTVGDQPVERVLVVTAHPDDVDFGYAGTIATFTDAGIQVVYCIITNGDAGGSDREVARDHMARMRQEEQREAARILGVEDVHFLGYPDGRLYVTHELRRDISRLIRQVRPHRLLTQSPERNWQRIYASHPDHLAAGEAALCAVYPDARNPFAHPELLAEGWEPWSVPEVWLGSFGEPDIHVDVTDQFDRKIKALQAHASQTSHMDDLEERIRGWLTAQAANAGLPEGRLAEGFRVVNTA